MASGLPLWEASHMESTLQRFTRLAVEAGGKARDHYDKEVQRLTGTKGKVLYDITRGKSANPSAKTLEAIAEVLGQPMGLLLSAARGEQVDPIEPGSAPPTMPAPPPVVNDDRAVDIIKLDMSLAMGDGTHIDDYVEETAWRFDIDFIRSFTRTPPHRIRIATGVGDSMFPTILSSDAVFFDDTQTRLNLQDKIWACSIRGGGAIKRLRIGDNRKIIVLSDNPSVPDDVVDEDDVRLFGRVLRLMRDL